MTKENSVYEIENGKFKQHVDNKAQKVWVQFEDTVVRIRPVNKNESRIFYFREVADSASLSLHLVKNSFDIDVVTIPFKYRPSVKGFPNQLNANFSGALYVGHRQDYYRFYYRANPIGENRRKLSHMGLSYGVFCGIGSSVINLWVTQGQVISEYDGFLFMNGIAGLVAVNKITFGLGLGVDHLLDKNDKYWIYHQKPWLGLTVGLNLN